MKRETMTAVRDAASKAGTLVIAALAIASCALAIALTALIIAARARHVPG